MNRYHLVQLARQTFDSLVNYQTYNPNVINNSCYLIGFFPKNPNEKLTMRNVLLNYFMNESFQAKVTYSEPTTLELKQLAYIKAKWQTEDLENYIKNIDNEVDDGLKDEEQFDPKDHRSLDFIFTAADEHIEGVLPIDPEKPEVVLPNVEVKLEPYDTKKKAGRPGRKK